MEANERLSLYSESKAKVCFYMDGQKLPFYPRDGYSILKRYLPRLSIGWNIFYHFSHKNKLFDFIFGIFFTGYGKFHIPDWELIKINWRLTYGRK